MTGNHFLIDVNWIDVNYAPLTVGGAFLLFGGWWVISAKNWFKGPISMGSEAELEQIEAQIEGGARRLNDLEADGPRRQLGGGGGRWWRS